jgi:hypothetical protein
VLPIEAAPAKRSEHKREEEGHEKAPTGHPSGAEVHPAEGHKEGAENHKEGGAEEKEHLYGSQHGKEEDNDWPVKNDLYLVRCKIFVLFFKRQLHPENGYHDNGKRVIICLI